MGPVAAKVFTDVDPEIVEEGLRTLAEVGDQGFDHAPRLLRSMSGAYAAATSAGAVALMEYVPISATSSEQFWEDLGGVLACLNRISAPRPFAIPIGVALSHQIERATGTPYATGVRELVHRLEPLGRLPRDGVVHGEGNPSNAGRRLNGQLVLLDWDQAGVGPAALDYSYPLITQQISEALDVDTAAIRGFYGSYKAAGGGVDPSALMNAALFHALRYMWFANTDVRWARIRYALEVEHDLVALACDH